MQNCQETIDKISKDESHRVAMYVDGFNLYYPISELGQPHLKWLNLWAVAEMLSANLEHGPLQKVVFCTAFPKRNIDKKIRHERYVEALEAHGEHVDLGHHLIREHVCLGECKSVTEVEAEKQTDINVALSLYQDAHDNVFDYAYLVSADSDQAATAYFLKKHFPDKKLISVAPPKRDHSNKLLSRADGKVKIDEIVLKACRLPEIILPSPPTIMKAIRCPDEYKMPASLVASTHKNALT